MTVAWGNVAEWVTAGSVATGFFSLWAQVRRDRRAREYEIRTRAAAVAFVFEAPETNQYGTSDARLYVHSPMQSISHVEVTLHAVPPNGQKTAIQVPTIMTVALGEQHVADLDLNPIQGAKSSEWKHALEAKFIDGHGNHWCRTEDGSLQLLAPARVITL
jgi:hypothetical protein